MRFRLHVWLKPATSKPEKLKRRASVACPGRRQAEGAWWRGRAHRVIHHALHIIGHVLQARALTIRAIRAGLTGNRLLGREAA